MPRLESRERQPSVEAAVESAQVQVTVWIGGRVRGEMYCVQLQQSTSDELFAISRASAAVAVDSSRTTAHHQLRRVDSVDKRR